MKKNWYKWMMPVALVACGLMTVACGDDDGGDGDGTGDNGGGGSSASATGSALVIPQDLRLVEVEVIDEFDEDYIDSYKKYTFDYDAQGRLARMVEDYGYDGSDGIRFVHADGNNSFVMYEEYDGEIDDYISGEISYTNQGYVSSISAVFSEKGDSWQESGNIVINFKYDGNGHLTKMTESGKDKGYEIYDGEKYSWDYSWNAENKLVWSNNILQSATAKFEWNEDEDGWMETEKHDCNFTFYYNKNWNNKYNQCSQSFIQVLCAVGDEGGEEFAPMALLGMLGKGSAQLPSSAVISGQEQEYSEEDGESDQDSYSAEFEYDYDFSVNGKLVCETVNGEYFEYVYANDAKSSVAPKKSNTVKSKAKQQTRREQRRAMLLKRALKNVQR